MIRQIDDEVTYYYDSHATEKDVMGRPSIHPMVVNYLWDVLKWLLHEQVCAIYSNLNFYHTTNPYEYPMEPDLAVIKGVPIQDVRSWKVDKTGSAPQVVLEVAIEQTWKKTLQERPGLYAKMGVQEYFAYDPNEPPILRATSQRLFGWHLDKDIRMMQEMPVGPGGRLWSTHLDSFLIPTCTLRGHSKMGKIGHRVKKRRIVLKS